MKQINKMDDNDEFILRSARLVNFEYRITKKLEANPELLAIKDDIDAIVNKFQIALK